MQQKHKNYRNTAKKTGNCANRKRQRHDVFSATLSHHATKTVTQMSLLAKWQIPKTLWHVLCSIICVWQWDPTKNLE